MRETLLDGIINLYKPNGITSQSAVTAVKRALGIKKAGHGGTLDPMAEGVLPILIGSATRAQDEIMHGGKTYFAKLLLGVTTDTEDITGNVLTRCEVKADLDAVKAAAKQFEGDIMQTPPMYSALKQNGVRLYTLGRAGIEVERQARPITVYSIDVTDEDCGENEFAIRVKCSKGTYIRTICADIGKALGCGATMTYLCRERLTVFDKADAVTLEQFKAAAEKGEAERYIIPTDNVYSHLDKAVLDERQQRLMKNGVRLDAPREKLAPLNADGARARVYSKNGDFLGVAVCKDIDGALMVYMDINF